MVYQPRRAQGKNFFPLAAKFSRNFAGMLWVKILPAICALKDIDNPD
jgi:hypothetical protein